MRLPHEEVAKFLRTQEVGKFEKDELLSIATEALAKSKPSEKWAREAISGALFDFVRTRDKLVTRWMDEDEYRAKAAELDDILPTARTARPKPCTIPSDNPLVEGWRKRHRVTVGPPPRRVRRRVRHPITGEMHELPSRIAASTGYKVNSKYNKVEVAPRRSPHQDGRDQNESGCSWKRPKIEDTENSGAIDPRGVTRWTGDRGEAPPERGGKSSRDVNLLTRLVAEPHHKHLLCKLSLLEEEMENKRADGWRPPRASATASARAWQLRFGVVEPEGKFDLDTHRWWPQDWRAARYLRPTWQPPPYGKYAFFPAEKRHHKYRTVLLEPYPVKTLKPKLAPKPPLRTEAWWTAVREEGPQFSSPHWQRSAGDFQITWGKLVIHAGNADEYVLRERKVDGVTRWLCERVDKLFSPAIDFRDYWGDILIRGALTVSIARPSEGGSSDLAAPPFVLDEDSEAQPAGSDDRSVPKLCQIDIERRRNAVQGPPRPSTLADTRWRPARTVVTGRYTA